ncbi:hypothetical protein BC567DRAFT_214253 [Phyllosticta citribraziliensis]
MYSFTDRLFPPTLRSGQREESRSQKNDCLCSQSNNQQCDVLESRFQQSRIDFAVQKSAEERR